MDGVVDRVRELYVDHAIHAVQALPGAAESIAAVRRHGGRVLVVTGKFEPNARRHVGHLALDIDHIELPATPERVWRALQGQYDTPPLER